MIVYPSILEKTPDDLFAQIKKLSPYFNTFQVDIADGVDVPNKTVQIEEIIDHVTHNIEHETYKNKSFEFHLMVKDWKSEIEKLKKLQKYMNINSVLIRAKYFFPNNQYLITNNLSLGLVLYPKDTVDLLSSTFNLRNIPAIQIMTITPGAQGKPFRVDLLNKIQQLRENNYRNKIALDGGINEKTLPLILSQKYLPDILCLGSFLTKTETIKKLKNNIEILNKLCL